MTQLNVIARALRQGGRAQITVRSNKTGQHVTLLLVCRKRSGDGRWLSRATHAGRVGLSDADCIEIRDPDLEYPDNYIGRYHLRKGHERFFNICWAPCIRADHKRTWAAEAILYAALDGRIWTTCTMHLSDHCCACGRELTDPESIKRGIGPECFGKKTGSRMARRDQPLQTSLV